VSTAAACLAAVLVVLIFFMACSDHAHAEPELAAETIEAAQQAGVDARDLQGAVNTTGLDPLTYLCVVGEGACPPVPTLANGWPIEGPLGQRIYCIERIESNHGRYMYNPIPVGTEHAQGWLGFLPSTARRYGVTIGNRASEWAGAATMIRSGAGNQFFGVATGQC